MNLVSRIQWHSTPSVTLEISGHLYKEMQDEAACLMDELGSPVKVNFTKKSLGVKSRNFNLPSNLH